MEENSRCACRGPDGPLNKSYVTDKNCCFQFSCLLTSDFFGSFVELQLFVLIKYLRITRA